MGAIINGLINGLAQLSGFLPSVQSMNAMYDREHTEMREDTAVQRLVADYRAAGLNPYTIPAGSGASSSASNVGSQSNEASLNFLGALLDIGNLSAKNRKITNDLITGVLGKFKKL